MVHMLLNYGLLLCAAIAASGGQECSEDTRRRCRREVQEALSVEHSNADQQCRSLREQLDCIVWQTSMCLDKDEQEANRDVITRAWRYLKSFCEAQGSWYTKACFQREDVRRCEALLPVTRSYSTDTSSCRSFATFRDCVTPVVQMDCSTEDRRLLGTYLMEKGQQRAWNCPKGHSTYPTSASLADMNRESYDEQLCSEDARGALQDCRTEFYSQQKDARTRNDSDMRHHKTCCALVQYEGCIGRTLIDTCGETRGRTETRALVSDMKQRFPYHSCEDHTATECSSTAALLAPPLLIMLLALLLPWKQL